MERNITRTYRLTRETVNRLERLAGGMEVYHSELVEMLLSTAFDQVEGGHWKVRTRPGRPELNGIEVRAGEIPATWRR